MPPRSTPDRAPYARSRLRGPAVWLLLACAGCLHPLPTAYLKPLAPPLQLAQGAPEGSCEQERWLWATPVDAHATGSVTVGDLSTGYVTTSSVTLQREGLSVSRGQPATPLGFDQVDALLGTPPALSGHRRALQRTESTWRWTQPIPWLGVMGVGTAGLLGSLVIENDALQATAIYGSLVPLLAGGTMAPIGLVLPGPRAQARYGLRSASFAADEDDLEDLLDRIDVANRQIREDCGTAPAGAR